MMPMKFTARKSSHVAVSWSNISPALFTRQSTCPNVSTTCFAHRRHLLGVAHVGLDHERATTERLDVVLDRTGLVDALEVDDRDVGALTRQRPRVRRADALRRTGHDADLALESLPHRFPLAPCTGHGHALTGRRYI